MPDKSSVVVEFQSRQQEGGVERSTLVGQLHRLKTSWVLTCRQSANDDADAPADASMTLIMRDAEIRLRRSGAISLEQSFRAGEDIPGTLDTPYGLHRVSAKTHRLSIGLSASGGIVEWEYELIMQQQAVGTFCIRLDIREEQSE